MVSAAFEKAAEESRQLTKKPSNEELLDLYALYKVARQEDFAAAAAPGMFDLKAKAKYKAWKKYIEEEPLSPSEAEERYIALVERLKVVYEFDPSKVPEKTASD